MKTLFLFFILCLSPSLFARQYIQCADDQNFDRFVINLDGENSTLFSTSGVHLPQEDYRLEKIFFEGQDQDFHVYATRSQDKQTVYIPGHIIGINSQLFYVNLIEQLANQKLPFSRQLACFSALYED